MKESYWGYLFIGLGLGIFAVILLAQNLTSTNEQDYHLTREDVKAAMLEAVDYGSFRESGKLVMSKEKFVAVFTRRFAESVPADRTYQLDFYDISEFPPKATVKVSTKTGEQVINDSVVDYDINTYLTAILETVPDEDLKKNAEVDGH